MKTIWHDVECGGLRGRPAALGGAGRRGRRSGPRPRLRHRPRRAAPGRPRAPGAGAGQRRGADRRPRRTQPRAGGRGGGRRRHGTSRLGVEFGLAPGADADPAALRRRRGADRMPRLQRAAHLRVGGPRRGAIVDELPIADAASAPLPDAREVGGWVYSSLPLETVVDGDAIVVRRLRQAVSPDGELSEEVDEVRLQVAGRRHARVRGATGRPPSGRAPRDPGHRRPRRLDRRPASKARRPDGAARPRPLSRADEHLRRPRQHRLPAAALRVARDRLLLRGGRAAAEPIDPGAHDLIYLGGGQDRDQRAVAADMVASKREALAGGGGRRRRPARRLRRLPAARPQLSARRGAPARARPGRPGDGARARRAADRQRRDRGRSRRRPADRSPASRTTAAAPTSARTPSRSAGFSAASATTARTGSRGCGVAT